MRIRLAIVQTAFAIVVAGACLTFLPKGEAKVEPPENSGGHVDWNGAKGQLRLRYHDADILGASVRIRSAHGERDVRAEEVLLTAHSTSATMPCMIASGTGSRSGRRMGAPASSRRRRLPLPRGSPGPAAALRSNSSSGRCARRRFRAERLGRRQFPG